MLPVLGTCLIILAGPDRWCNRWILSDRRMVFVGLISYPLYLWHWPLLSFQRILGGQAVPVTARAAAIGLAFLLAWLTYAVVERPVRFASKHPAKIAVLATLGLAIGVLGYVTLAQNGLPSRRVVAMNPVIGSGNIASADDHMIAGCGLADPGNFLLCHHDGRSAPTIALFGDSKAGALAEGLLAESGAGDRWLLIGQPNEPVFSPIAGLGREALETLAGNHDVKLVVVTIAIRNLFGIWNDQPLDSLPSNPNANVAFGMLDETVAALVAGGKKVVITIDNPTLRDPKFCVARATAIRQIDWLVGIGEKRAGCAIQYDRQLELTANYRAVLDRLARKYPNHLRLFDPLPTLCDVTAKECSFLMNGRLLYSYGDHISGYAAAAVAEKLIPLVERFAAEPAVADGQL